MKQERTTVFYSIDQQIIELFVSMINEQVETKRYSSTVELFKHMRSNQLQMIKNSGIRKNVKLLNDQSTFCYQLTKAFCKSNLDCKNPKDIAQYIYQNIVLSGLHTCPDTIINNIEYVAKTALN